MVEVFVDVGCGSEVCSDGYPITSAFEEAQFEKIAFEAKSRMISKGNEDYGISCNVDEDAGEGATAEGEATAVKVIDIADAFELQEVATDKKFFKSYFASYMKNVLLPSVPEAEVADFKTNVQALFLRMMNEFDNGQLYQAAKATEAEDSLKCMPIFAYWKGEEEAPRFIYFKHGVKSQKY